MADIHSKEVRSYNMSKIKAKNTKPEVVVRKFLFSKGLRFRLHAKYLSGKPDIVLPKYKTLIFVNGCFWHGHDKCKYFVIPKTRTEWWLSKINRNIERDKENIRKLTLEGWKIITVFECQLRSQSIHSTLNSILSEITSLSFTK